ncbi:glycosyltransferase family 2 protein [Heyndrickxia coagulans]|jgi:glycosyltransferase involved in cell wall biosynthesis|uniref:glycosyltransferase family 2 protein n=2 Tax=Bacteria TaxID=2 RepID=UPI00069A52A4|nr:glycosyltransferase family 2 protein [Heyndrickxia coagulans]UXC22888.1 glycosyltransferase [Heyndrickxia coagulans]
MISVIVPIYNTEKYLTRCLKSITNQTYEDLEIILVDDGSTDDSFLICEEYAKNDSRIKLLRKRNEGQGSARNLGLEVCNGEYIGFVDSDDYILPGMYQIMLEHIKKYKADIAICGMSRDHGFALREMPMPDKFQIYNNISLMKNYISTPHITSSVCNKLYSRKLWENVYFPSIRAREDVSILYKVLANSKCAVHVGSCQYIQYVRPGSTERKKFDEKKLSAILASKSNQEFIESKYPDLIKYSFLRVADTYASLMQEIISSFQYLDKKDLYRNLYKSLTTELKSKYELKYLDTDKYNHLQDIVENQFLFFLRSYLYGLKTLVVNLMTKISFQLKEK